jgi:hypothetical protein
MRGGGALPTEESFKLEEVAVFPDQEVAEGDIAKLTQGSLLEIKVSDRSLLKIPLRLAIKYADYGGHFTQATAASRALIGPVGAGYYLDIPIVIPGGTKFVVRILQKTALSASTKVKVVLNGILSRP